MKVRGKRAPSRHYKFGYDFLSAKGGCWNLLKNIPVLGVIIISEKPGLSLLKQMYFNEIQVKEMLNSRVQVPFTILSLLVAVLTYMKANMPSQPKFAAFVIFMFACELSFLFILAALLYLCKAMVARDFKYLPSANQIAEYIACLEEYHSRERIVTPLNQYINNQIDDMIYDHIVKHSSTNFNQNVDRINSIQASNVYVMVSLISTVLGFLMFVML